MKRKKSNKAGVKEEKSLRPIGAATESNRQSRPHVVVVAIGASAGGLEAFTKLLSHLPTDTGMAFVLVQHLDPKHESMLTELISRSTKMSVVEVRNGMGIEANHVYVIPPNTTMSIDDDILRLSARTEGRGQHMVVDHFMRALAEERGNKAIGVILSGSGTDGTLGLAEIQAQGGVTFAQDETTAEHDGMPRSAIASGCVDFVLPPTEIAQELTRIARHPYVTRGPKDEAADLVPEQHVGLSTIFRLIRKSTGVDFTHYRQSTIRRRIQRRMIVHKIDTLPRYVKYVQENPAELKALYQDMLINVTSFFRARSLFDALKTRILPAMLKGRSGESPLRLWSPGCSSGEETYSLAIAVLEFLADRSSQPIQVFGSDVSETSINKARNGLYRENIQGDVSPERLRRFFVKVEGGYRINKNVRDMCIFAQHNLLADPPFSQMDLICCRNLLIYLEAPLQKKIISLFHYALKPHGILVLGNAESVGAMNNLFALEDRANKIYTKRAATTRTSVAFSMGQREKGETGAGPRLAARHEPQLGPAEAQKEFDRRLLQRFTPAAVFVDEALEVVHSRGDVDRYLKISPGRASLSILKMAREGLVLALRSAITRAKKENTTVRRENAEIQTDHATRQISFEVTPLRVTQTPELYFMIVFEEAGAEREHHTGKQRVVAIRKESSSKRALKLQQELAATGEYLHTVIENQEATNEELQSANEEILSSNEELQSTNEELETAKEELQSVNEELTTVNDELRNRNQEITRANNDLTNLLNSIDVPVLMLGSDLSIRRFTPEAQRILGLIPADMGRSFITVNAGFDMPELHNLIAQVMSTFIPIERPVRVRTGKSYFLRITPYRTIENKVEGAVLTLTLALTDKQRGEAAAAEHPTEFMLVLDLELHIKAATASFYRTLRVNPESVQNRPIQSLNHVVSDNPQLERALEKARDTNEPISPFMVELQTDPDKRRKFDCKLERIALPGGARLIALSMLAPFTEQQRLQAGT